MSNHDDPMAHHEAFVARHGAQLHQIARDNWRSRGRGLIIIDRDGRDHTVCYLTETNYQRNIADGIYADEMAEAGGGLLVQYTDPEQAFPIIMNHGGVFTCSMVQPIPVRMPERPEEN